MSDPNAPTTWLGLNPAILLALATGLGAALTKGIGALWKVITGREANAVLLAENTRLREALDKVGKEKDELVKIQLRMAASVLRGRSDPKIPNEFEEDYPSAVRNLADLMDPNAQHKPDAVLDATLRGYTDTTPPKLQPPRPPPKPK